MVGLILAVALVTLSWPVRPTFASLRSNSVSLIVPALLLAAVYEHASGTEAMPVYVGLALLAVGASILQRRRARAIGREGPATAIWRSSNRSIALAGLLIVWVVAKSYQAGESLLWSASVLVVLGAVGICLASMRPSADESVRAIVWFASVGIAIALAFGGATGEEWRDCSAEFSKCTPVGQIYAGVFSSENVLALFASFTVVCAGGIGFRRRRALMAVLVLVVLLTGSRSSPLSLLLAALAYAVVWVTARPIPQGFRAHKAVSYTAVAAVSIASAGLILSAGDGDYSARGTLWRSITSRSPLDSALGLSQYTYKGFLELGAFRGHYPHSQVLLLSFFGGLLAIALYMAAFGTLWADTRATSRHALAGSVAPIAFLLAIGLTETAWNPAAHDSTTWIVVALFAMRPALPPPAPVVRSPERRSDRVTEPARR